MLYQQTLDTCFQPAIGERGVSEKDFAAACQNAATVVTSLKQKAANNSLPVLNSAYKQDDVAEMLEIGKRIRDNFTDLVILGTGGSSLNPQALIGLNVHPYLTASRNTIRFHFLDNIDPHTVDHLLDNLDLKTTAFLAISKSGSTLETVSLTLVCIEAVQKKLSNGSLAERFFFITDPIDCVMRRMAKAIGAHISDHEPGIGGRFSSLTNVGLLPAVIAGLDPVAFREGGIHVMEDTFNNKDSSTAEAVKSAVVNLELLKKNFPIAVMMPYVDRLSGFASWHRQTWAESLGKKGVNTTVIKATGTLDQHSQLQLYLDGPRDKMFTFIMLDHHSEGRQVQPSIVPDKDTAYLEGGKTLGDILEAEQVATANTLVRNQCPLRTWRLPKLDERVVGALLMHSMMEIIIMADMLKINAFDQPAVEQSKALTRELLKKEREATTKASYQASNFS